MIFVCLCAAERRCEQCYGRPMVAPTDYILFRTVGADSISARIKQTARTNNMAVHKIPPFIVGTGVLDCPLYINVFSGRRRRRPLPRYRETVHSFSAKGLCEHNTGGASPYPTEIERDPLFVRSRKVVRTTLRREQAPALQMLINIRRVDER